MFLGNKQRGGRRTRFVRRLPPALAIQVIEDSGDDIGIFNASNDLHRATAEFAHLDIDAEYSFEAACPRHRAMLLCGGQQLTVGGLLNESSAWQQSC